MIHLKTVLSNRPLMQFDPRKAEHRKYFQDFLKNKSWKNCPYQWFILDDSHDVVHYINKLLVDYYIHEEFVAKKPRKPRKIVKIEDLGLKKRTKNG